MRQSTMWVCQKPLFWSHGSQSSPFGNKLGIIWPLFSLTIEGVLYWSCHLHTSHITHLHTPSQTLALIALFFHTHPLSAFNANCKQAQAILTNYYTALISSTSTRKMMVLAIIGSFTWRSSSLRKFTKQLVAVGGFLILAGASLSAFMLLFKACQTYR